MAWTPNRILALVVGIVFTLVGIMGFFFTSSMTPASELGFQVDLVHNLVHLVIGIAGIAAAYTGWSRTYNQVVGIVYLLVGVAGLIPGLYFDQRLLGLMHVNAADNVLHLVVGAVQAVVGFGVGERTTRTTVA
jgi:hypothetical protein